MLLLGDDGETTESLKHTLSSIKKDLQKERDESNEEGLNAMKISLSAALENDEIVFARIDCAKQRGRVKRIPSKGILEPRVESAAIHFRQTR